MTDAANFHASGDGHGARDRFYRSSNGLNLHAVDYGDVNAPWLPVVCLPGLSRTTRDFDSLARHLSQHRHRPRRVVAFDYRGRGRSDWDPDPANYNPLTEMNDILDGMAALGIAKAIFVGTSRGGIISMLVAVARPNVLAGLVLNDLGPVIEPIGLARLKTSIGRTPPPENWDDAVAIQRRLLGSQFPALSDADWIAMARMTYRDVGGSPEVDYDPALARTLDGVELDQPIPDMWSQYEALSNLPVLAIRGSESDILSADTLKKMAETRPHAETVTIDGQGHPPLLIHTPVLQRISVFMTSVEPNGLPADAIIPKPPVDFDLDADDKPAT